MSIALTGLFLTYFIDNNANRTIKILFTIISLKKLFRQNAIYDSFRLKKNT